MSLVTACVNQENELETSGWSIRERVEHAASLFLIENRERIIGPDAFLKTPGIYRTRVQELLKVKERIDHLRRSARALETYKARRIACRLSMAHMLGNVLVEMKAREAEEQEKLEGVFEVAAEIVRLGRAK